MNLQEQLEHARLAQAVALHHANIARFEADRLSYQIQLAQVDANIESQRLAIEAAEEALRGASDDRAIELDD